ncbi:MAG: NUDIX hydrolase [Actinomycetes bacterium]
MSKKARKPHEQSAGGVVLNGDDVCVIVPVRRTANGKRALALPKGHVDKGETIEETALREVLEETGLQTEAVRELGEVRYWYRRGGKSIDKSVYYFELRVTGGSFDDHDDEVEEVRWMPISEALEALTFDGERGMLKLAAGL